MKKLPFFGSKNKDEKSKENKQGNENNNNNAINKQKLFGVPLAEIMSRPQEATYSIPSVVFDCLLAIEQKGFGTHLEGIFRQPGNKTDIDAAKVSYDSGLNAKQMKVLKDVHGAAGLLLCFFRELPECVVFKANVKPLCEAAHCLDIEHAIFLQKNIIASLPIANKVLLKRFFSLLSKIASHKAENKMGANNLATCVGLAVMHPSTDPIEALSSVPKIQKALEFMIDHFSEVFADIPDSLYNALQRQSSSTNIAPQLLAKYANQSASQAQHASMHIPNRHRRSLSVDSGMAGIPQVQPPTTNQNQQQQQKKFVQMMGTSIRNLLMGDEKEEEDEPTAPASVSVPLKTLKPQLSTLNLHHQLFASQMNESPLSPIKQTQQQTISENIILTPVKQTPDKRQQEEFIYSPMAQSPSVLGKRKDRSYAELSAMSVMDLVSEEAKLKNTLRQWETDFENQHGRLPGKEDKALQMAETYERYFELKLVKKQRVETPSKSVQNNNNNNENLANVLSPRMQLEENKKKLRNQLNQWKAEFVRNNGREPTTSDFGSDVNLRSAYDSYMVLRRTLNKPVLDL